MDEYVSVLYEIVTRGLTTNSYKFALWRALARLAPTTDERSPKIFKGALSPLFLEYYWPLEVKYHIRQGIDPDKDPIVMRLIRQSVRAGMIMEGETLADFRRRMPDKHNIGARRPSCSPAPRPGASPPKSPNFLGVASQAA
jgi:hypothetical protein